MQGHLISGSLANQHLLAMFCKNCNSDQKLVQVARDLLVCEDCCDKLMSTSVERGISDEENESDGTETGSESNDACKRPLGRLD